MFMYDVREQLNRATKACGVMGEHPLLITENCSVFHVVSWWLTFLFKLTGDALSFHSI